MVPYVNLSPGVDKRAPVGYGHRMSNAPDPRYPNRPLGLTNVQAGTYGPHPVTGVMHFTDLTRGAWGNVDDAIAYVRKSRFANAIRITPVAQDDTTPIVMVVA